MTERSGIEIDYCPECRGVWLDKGELDKIIDRSSSSSSQQSTEIYPPRQHYQKDNDYKYKKRKGFLGDLFDFD